ncbi:MAG: ATP-binding protein [Acidilobaceae archaeon]
MFWRGFLLVVCDVCGLRGARVFQAYSGLRLCGECFVESVRSRVWGEVERWGLIEPGDSVLLAVSGGKDSYVMLESLALRYKASRLIGLSIIEGIPGYNREDDVRALIDFAKSYGVDVVVVSVRDYVGLSVYEMVREARSRGLAESACTFCGLSRRHIMDYYARMLGASKVATAHNLDDEVQTLVMNMLRGDIIGVLKVHPLSPHPEDGVRRVKPLRKIYEWETAAYAMIRGFRFQETECMFIEENPTLRAKVRVALYEIERENPGSLLGFLEYFDELLGSVARGVEVRGSTSICTKCGALTTRGRRLCKLCELLEGISLGEPLYVKLRLNVESRRL